MIKRKENNSSPFFAFQAVSDLHERLTLSALPRGLNYVSNKLFHTIFMCLNVNQILVRCTFDFQGTVTAWKTATFEKCRVTPCKIACLPCVTKYSFYCLGLGFYCPQMLKTLFCPLGVNHGYISLLPYQTIPRRFCYCSFLSSN